MALKPCRECGKEVSTKAKTCPQCGISHPTSQLDRGTKQALGCLALIIVVVVIGQIGSQSSAPPATNNAQTATPSAARGSSTRKRSGNPTVPKQSSAARAAPPGAHRINGDHWFGCMDRDEFGRLVNYAVQNDQEAFSQALTRAVYNGTCTLFQNGETVYLTDTGIFSGVVKVRKRGETTEYWTNMEAIQ